MRHGPVRYGRGNLREDLARELRALRPRPTAVFVLLDRRAARAARRPIAAALQDAGLGARWIPWRAAERRKTLAEAERLARRIVRAGVDRQSLLLAAGGGVTTDVGGFVAAVLLRGIRWGAVPTTLLGMVDAALGGKTAVDLPEGKNLLGAFHGPEFVVGDVDALRTLPAREWRCGLGEALKTALIGGPALLRRLEAAPPASLRRPSPAVLDLARACARVKLRIVTADPREETGARALLNLGHTFGHALEAASGYRLAHGEAVALGLLCGLHFSVEGGIAPRARLHRIRRLARRMRLPARYDGRLPDLRRLAAFLARDKKASGGRLTLLLPCATGSVVRISGVSPLQAAAALRNALSTL